MPPNHLPPAVVGLSESQALASAVARQAGIAVLPLEERAFDGGEFKLRPLESVRGRQLFVVQSLAATAEEPAPARLVRLMFLLQGLRDGGADSRMVVMPYFAFARKDRRTQLRDPVTARYVAELLEAAGADGLIGLDVHNPAAFDNAFRIPTVHMSALPMLVEHFLRRLDARTPITVVSPDVGGIKRAQIFRELLSARCGREIGLAFVEKRRARGIVASGALAGERAAHSAVELDDLCATGGTLIRAASACREGGAAAVHVAVTHTPLDAGLAALIAAEPIDSITTTDSVGFALPAAHAPGATDRLVTLPVAPLFAAALRRMLAGEPVAPLLEHWPG
ncbi:MAG: ribose-phosphate diphosphokinase [Steroidobacteraceae bacterium]